MANIFAADFRHLPGLEDLYWVEVHLEGEHREVVPGPHTRICITIAGQSAQTMQYFRRQLTGEILPDMFGSDVALAVLVRMKQQHPRVPDGRYRVGLTLEGEITNCQLHDAAIVDLLMKPLKRERGLSLQRWYFNSRFNQPPQDEASLWHEVENCAEPTSTMERFEGVLTDLNLDKKQRVFALQTLKSLQGIVMLSGLPETGKSYNLMATITAHVVMGRMPGMTRRQTLITAPTSAGIRALLKMFIDSGVFKTYDIEACLFIAGPVRKPGVSTQSTMLQRAVDMARPAGHDSKRNEEAWAAIESLPPDSYADPELSDYYFHNRRTKFIEGREATEAMPESHEGLSDQRYLKEKVDVVFCTNGGSAHPTLMEHFTPRILVQDDATLGSKMDSMMPAAAFQEAVEMVLFAGDHTKKGPPLGSRGQNEFANLMEGTLFADILGNKSLEENVDKIMLVDKYQSLDDRLAGLQIQ